MDIKLIILTIVGIMACIYSLYLLYNMPSEIMKNMEREVKEYIEKHDKEYEERQELNKALRKWLFRQT